MGTSIVNKRSGANYDVDITRPSLYSNPFIIGQDGDRAEVIRKFADYAKTRFSNSQLLFLKGKTLGCVCKPKNCHGDILVMMADACNDI